MTPTDEELIELLRRNNEALNRGDFDAVIERGHPDIVFVQPGGLPVLRGMEAVRAWMEPDAFEGKVTRVEVFTVNEEDAARRALKCGP
ncbi:MAG TPA: nuclear transport factor 2 family protein [Solirubrobacterales bacterium]